MQAATFEKPLFEQLNPSGMVGEVRGGLLGRNIRRSDIVTIVHFELLAFDQSRRRRARTVPVAEVKTRLVEARPQVAHHPRQKSQFERRVGFDLLDIFVGELVAPTLHLADEVGLVRGRAPAVDHAFDDGTK